MSAEAAIEFVGKTLPANPALAVEVAKAVEGKNAKAAAAAVVAIGKQQGLDFTVDEALGARAALLDHFRKQKLIDDELSEQDLDQVAGGMTFYAENFTRIGSASYWQSAGQGIASLGQASTWQQAGQGMKSLGQASTWKNAVTSVFSGW
ncbi:MAG: hypothetical protein FJX62_11425 [Alphaproteobacteria bacterium]|nr:hypothetical protein [Alphaproteobacteria bacterium]